MKFDFSNCKLSNKFYGGSERKLGIVFNNEEYMLKFQKNSPFGKRFNHISEYLGSHIFNLLGIKTQQTLLGVYRGKEVVACKDFVGNSVFVPFNDVGESTLEQDKEKFQYSYEDIMEMLKSNCKLTSVDSSINLFWDMYIVDALIGNFDRHGLNWGFLKNNNKYTLAPVFDNGSSLFPQMIDEDEMLKIIDSEVETNKRVILFPTSQIKLNNDKSSYYDVINSLKFKECNDALIRIYERIDLEKIFELINNISFISEIHKSFYKHIIASRYNMIIKKSYLKLKEQNHE